jgi:F0F1-type ATP synthase membrane subunit b/b'
MPPATKRRQLGMIARSPLQLVALLILLALSSSTAALFGRNNNKVVVDPPPTTGGDEKDDAVSNAKRLIDELNSAAMGTVTAYDSSSTKREKEPATCDSIMAKSLVLANEEKAAVAAQLDSVVKAAGLLSTQIEDLYSSLDIAGGEIAALRKELGDKSEEFQDEVDARERRAAERVAEVERALADARSEHATAIKALEEDAERTLLVEREASKVKIDALRNTTADAISQVEREAKLRIAKLEKSLNDAEARHSSITAEMRKDADARMDSCMAKSDMDRESIMKHANDQIEAAKGQARRELDLKTKEINDIHHEHQTKLSDLSKSHAEKIEKVKQTMDSEMKKMVHAMEVAIAQKDLILSEERGENERLRSRMNELISEAASLQKSLRVDLEMARTSSFELEKVSEQSRPLQLSLGTISLVMT